LSGAGPAVLAATLAFFAWNFFFLPPYHTLQIHDPQDWLSLVAFLVVGLIVGIQAGRMHEREARALAREREAMTLNRVSAQLVSQTTTEAMAETVLAEIVTSLQPPASTLFLAEGGELRALCSAPQGACAATAESEVAAWVYLHNEPLGLPGAPQAPPNAATPPSAPEGGGMYLPLRCPSGLSGVLAVAPRADGRPYSPADARLVASLSNLVGAFLERQALQAAATRAEAEREAGSLKASLLSSVSHELKTPLAALTATVSNLLESDVDWDEESVRDELHAIVGDIARLNSSIGALLDLSRLEARAWEPRREPCDLADIVEAGIDALPAHRHRRIRVDLPEEPSIVDVDFAQWTLVLRNLMELSLIHISEPTRPY
jgi:two-component system sensor histidine kinase KdpD